MNIVPKRGRRLIFSDLSPPSFLPENRKRPKGQSKESEDITMIDLSEKSREEIYREKKEGELRLAKQKESEWKRRKDKERKCMIGGTFLKYFPDALLFEADEWDRITQAVIDTDAFKNTVEAIRKEEAIRQEQKPQTDSKQEHKPHKQERQPTKPKEPKTEKAPETANPENETQEQGHEGGNNG